MQLILKYLVVHGQKLIFNLEIPFMWPFVLSVSKICCQSKVQQEGQDQQETAPGVQEGMANGRRVGRGWRRGRRWERRGNGKDPSAILYWPSHTAVHLPGDVSRPQAVAGVEEVFLLFSFASSCSCSPSPLFPSLPFRRFFLSFLCWVPDSRVAPQLHVVFSTP